MISVNEAIKKILDTTPLTPTEKVNICEINKRVLSQKIIATRDQPPFNRVAMDGIAINIKYKNKIEFKIEGIQAAGAKQLELKNTENCIEVMTGASLPSNTNCVIRYEDTEIVDGIAKIQPNLNLYEYKNVHTQGSDYKENDELIASNTMINSTHIAIIASQGTSEVEVYKRPKIAIISTGDELVELNKKVEPHQIYLSNSYAIANLLKEFNFVDVSRHHIIDEFEKTKSQIEKIKSENDILILSGGVSMGKFGYIPKALNELGVKKHFHKIKQKPGKPMWYGTDENSKQIFALPGNPVSCLVCLRRYVIPSLFKRLNLTSDMHKVILTEPVSLKKEMTLFKAVSVKNLKANLSATPLISNGSGDFNSLARSTGFIELPAEKTDFPAGEALNYFSWTT